jgi:hypothetical protein
VFWRSAAVVEVPHRLHKSPSGETQQTHSNHCEQGLAKRFIQESPKCILAVSGAATSTDRGHGCEYANDDKY